MLTISQPENDGYWVLAMMYFGILSDVFDGIIARRLSVSTSEFRTLDTIFDLVFYLAVLLYVINREPSVFIENGELIVAILVLEVMMYTASLSRFGKLPSPHAIMSKMWGVYMIVEFTLIITGVEGLHFRIALFFGILAHIDRVLIYVLLREWDHDIPSCYHAWLLRQGRAIVRKKLFNG